MVLILSTLSNSASLKRGISGLIAAVIVVCVGIAIAVLVSLWISGIVSLSGVGGSPEKLEIIGDLNVRGKEFKLMIDNKGGSVSVIDTIYVDGKYEATVIDAYVYNKPWEKRLYDVGNGRLGALILPGERITVSCLLKQTELKPGTSHEIKITTARGSVFRRPVRASWSPIKLEVSAYDLGIKNPSTGSKLLLVKIHYYNAYTSNATHIDAKVIKLGSTVQELGSYSEDLIPPISPGSDADIEFTVQLSSSVSSTGNLVVKVKLMYSDGASDDSASFVSTGKSVMAYVIAINEIPGHWVDKSKVVYYVEKVLSNYHVIDNLAELYEFINDPESYSKKHGLPTSDVIVINAHGEAVPIPSPSIDTNHYYIDNNGIPVEENGHYKWYLKIRDDIVNYGWIWVAIDGYAFYYTYTYQPGIGNPSGDRDQSPDYVKYTTGEQGDRDILNVDYRVQSYESTSEMSYPTNLVNDVAKLLHDNSIYFTGGITTARPASASLSPLVKLWFYNVTGNPSYPYASALYSLGNGGYVLIDGWSYDNAADWKVNSDDFIAKSAVYFAVYSYVVTKIG